MTIVAAYAGLFLWSFLAATLVPLGSEPALVALVRSEGRFLLPLLVATAGNYLGACTTWFIGRGVAAVAFGPEENSERGWGEARARKLFVRYGQPSLLLSWLPLVGDAIVFVAGAARVPFVPFSLWFAAGKAARYAVVAAAALSIAR
jgi:membrane protein YqaA with SNARE-associated domain